MEAGDKALATLGATQKVEPRRPSAVFLGVTARKRISGNRRHLRLRCGGGDGVGPEAAADLRGDNLGGHRSDASPGPERTYPTWLRSVPETTGRPRSSTRPSTRSSRAGRSASGWSTNWGWQRTLRSWASTRSRDCPDQRAALRKLVNPVARLQSMIRVVPVRDSRMVPVSVMDTDPKRAALLSTSVAEEYRERRTSPGASRARAAWWTGWSSSSVTSSRGSRPARWHSTTTESAMTCLPPRLEDRRSIVSQKLLDLNRALTDMESRRIQLESKVGDQASPVCGEGGPVGIR